MRMKWLGLLLGICLTYACSVTADAGENPVVVFETSKGKIVVRLYADKAPLSAKNMLDYVNEGFYNGTIFHRVISGFVLQGGGFTADMKQKPTHAPIKNEAGNGLSNKRGTLSMARTMVVDSATSQFFVNVVDNKRLDHTSNDASGFGYAVFGEVIEGMDVVDAIRAVKTLCSTVEQSPCPASLPAGMRDVPAEPVTIVKAYVRK